MKIEILGWQCMGLRSADMKIDLFPNKSISRISLILLDSGGGKTTVCELIRHTLTGSIERLSPKEVLSYARPENNTFKTDEGYFELTVRFDEERYTFEVKFDFIHNTVKIATSSPDTRGHRDGYKPPTAAMEFLKRNFVDLYIYDGHQAGSILDGKSNVADLTIERINQLGYFDEIRVSLSDYFKKTKEESAVNTAARSQVKRLQNKIEAFQTRKKELKTLVQEKQRGLVNLGKAHKELTKEKQNIGEESRQAQERLKTFELAIKSDEAAINDCLKDILNSLKQPHHISKNIEKSYINFRNNLEKQKIPEQSSSAFFEEVAQGTTCICDQPITPTMKAAILKNSKKYMGSSFTSFFDHMKSDVKNFILIPNENNNQQALSDLEIKLKACKEGFLRNKQDAANISRTIQTSTGRNVADIDADIEKILEEQANIKILIDNFSKPDDTATEATNPNKIYSEVALDALIKSLKNQEVLSKRLLDINNKIDDINQLIDNCKARAKINIKEKLKIDMNKKLAQVITQDTIEIDEMGDSIKLKYIDRGSGGQNLALAYIFLTVALNQARESNQLPLLVDSPAGSIGQTIRENLVDMVTKNTSQFICLIQLGERQWFAEELFKNAEQDSSFYTVFLKNPTTQHYLTENVKGLTEYGNSAVVSGYQFLSEFSVPGRVREHLNV